MHSILACLLLFLSPFVTSTRADFEITDELLAEIGAVAVPEVKKATGAKFPDGVRILRATTAEIEAALLLEARAQMALQFEDEEVIADQARITAASLAPALMAKFRFEDRAVLVSQEGFHRLAKITNRPRLATKEALRAVLLHELVHAADEERYGFSKTLLSCTSTDALQSFNCVVEGHAQHVARGIATKLGWTEGFELFTEAIGALPSDEELAEMGAAMELVTRVRVATFASAYYQGETFMRAVEAEGGAKAVTRAFTVPPTETALIFEPTWYLHPEKRPRVSFALEAALDAIAADYPEPRWASTKISPTPAQLEVSLGSLPPATALRVKRSLLQSLVLSAVDRDATTQRVAVVGLLEFGSSADALHYLEVHRQLQKIADEEMREGLIKIISSTYEDLDDPAGLSTHKTVDAAGTEMEVRAVCLVRGRLATELVFTEMNVDAAEMRAVALRALDGAVASPDPPSPAGDEGGEGGDAGDGGEDGLPARPSPRADLPRSGGRGCQKPRGGRNSGRRGRFHGGAFPLHPRRHP